MCSENITKNCNKWSDSDSYLIEFNRSGVKLPKFEAVNRKSWSPKTGGKRFTATFKADMILHMRR